MCPLYFVPFCVIMQFIEFRFSQICLPADCRVSLDVNQTATCYLTSARVVPRGLTFAFGLAFSSDQESITHLNCFCVEGGIDRVSGERTEKGFSCCCSALDVVSERFAFKGRF